MRHYWPGHKLNLFTSHFSTTKIVVKTLKWAVSQDLHDTAVCSFTTAGLSLYPLVSDENKGFRVVILLL